MTALTVFLILASATDPAGPEAVAVVSSLSGSASVAATPGATKTATRLFDWLPAGAVIEVEAGSSLTLAFCNGNRYELGERTKATLTAAGVKGDSGVVRPLDPVPPIPRAAAIASEAKPGERSGAIRIRDQEDRIRNLYPRADSAALPEGAVLRFSPAPGASRYRVELEDETGRTVFDVETQAVTVSVPAGILKPGSRYFWKVRTLDRMGPAVRGESAFATLAAEDIGRRAAVKAALEGKGDAPSLALLAEIDRRLGLLAEAREEFRAALAKSPGDDAIRRALVEIEQRLGPEETGG